MIGIKSLKHSLACDLRCQAITIRITVKQKPSFLFSVVLCLSQIVYRISFSFWISPENETENHKNLNRSFSFSSHQSLTNCFSNGFAPVICGKNLGHTRAKILSEVPPLGIQVLCTCVELDVTAFLNSPRQTSKSVSKRREHGRELHKSFVSNVQITKWREMRPLTTRIWIPCSFLDLFGEEAKAIHFWTLRLSPSYTCNEEEHRAKAENVEILNSKGEA